MKAAGEIGPVFRGEHGEGAPAGGFHTRRPSISFGSRRAAEIYSRSPNDRALDRGASSPRVIQAFLAIHRPMVDQPDDPFVDASVLADALGEDAALRLLRRHAPAIENTNNWQERFSRRYRGVGDLLAEDPRAAIGGLYVEIHPLLDDPEAVAALRRAGFDGAIYGGSGENSGETEWRIFDPSQARIGRVFYGGGEEHPPLPESRAAHVRADRGPRGVVR